MINSQNITYLNLNFSMLMSIVTHKNYNIKIEVKFLNIISEHLNQNLCKYPIFEIVDHLFDKVGFKNYIDC